MNESIKLMPAAMADGQKSKLSPLESEANSAENDGVSGFTAVLTQYLQSDPEISEQQMGEEMAELLAALLPPGMLDDGKGLPGSENEVATQIMMQLQPLTNPATNSGPILQTQGVDLLNGQRKPVLNPAILNPAILNQGYFKTADINPTNLNPEQQLNMLSQGMVNQNGGIQLAAAHFNPATNEAFYLNINDQLIPTQTTTPLTNGLAAVGFGTATQAATTQAQMAPLHIGQNAWESNLASRIQMFVGQNVQNAEIRLDPPELGLLEIKIKIVNDSANLSFNSSNSQVRDAIETAVPRLKEMFEESGLSLGDVNVQQESFAHKENENEVEVSGVSDLNETEHEDEQTIISRKIVSNSLIDTYV